MSTDLLRCTECQEFGDPENMHRRGADGEWVHDDCDESDGPDYDPFYETETEA